MSSDNLALSELLNAKWLSSLESTIKAQPDAEKYLGKSREKTFPKRELTFAALNHVEGPENVKVVIFGQDPYPREESAIGVAFNDGAITKWSDSYSPSFRNIIKNVLIGRKLATSSTAVADLRRILANESILDPPDWFDSLLSQGVCWLNTSLTFTSTDQTDLKRHLAWWKPVVEKIIEVILEAKAKETDKEKKALVFVLWGGHAQKLAKSVKALNKHGLDVRFIDANHPAANGDAFHAVMSFESVNKHLEELGAKTINWLPTRSGSAPSGKRSAESDAPKAPASPAKAKPAPKAKAASKAAVKDDEDEKPAASSSGRPRRAASNITYQEDSSDGDDGESDDEEEKKTRKPPAKRSKKN
eukprot:TRINITY_DN6726_c0_g1_i1.p1 TRINITY_DN6726_c0_g1~~TRINITY_DN6726_c0_g1_i1.p1  ORF type:complete len:359 (+),score=106.84 TRINITY_DN6726_c0_g1_i1:31-1107(+)